MGQMSEQLMFPSLAFPKERRVLYVFEVAEMLRVTQRHVIDLIDEGKLKAVNIAGDNSTDRKFYRIPVESYDAFIRQSTVG